MTELNDVNIRHIKLSTGDELIAIVLSDEETENVSSNLLVVQRPMRIRTVERDRAVSFLFYEWQPLSDDDVCYINPMHVVSHVECSNDVKGQYINVCVNGDIDETDEQQSDLFNTDSDFDLDSDLDLNLIPIPSKTYH